jgi:hypothetical protein
VGLGAGVWAAGYDCLKTVVGEDREALAASSEMLGESGRIDLLDEGVGNGFDGEEAARAADGTGADANVIRARAAPLGLLGDKPGLQSLDLRRIWGGRSPCLSVGADLRASLPKELEGDATGPASAPDFLDLPADKGPHERRYSTQGAFGIRVPLHGCEFSRVQMRSLPSVVPR